MKVETRFNKFYFFKLTIILALTSPLNSFSMERIQQVYRHLTGAEAEKKFPRLTVANIKRYPQYKEQFIQDVETNFIEYTGKFSKNPNFKSALEALKELIKNESAINRLSPLVIKYFDQIDESFLLSFIEKNPNPEFFLPTLTANFSTIPFTMIKQLLILSPKFWNNIAELLLITPDSQFKGHSHLWRFLNTIEFLEADKYPEEHKKIYKNVLALMRKKSVEKTDQYPIENLDMLYPYLSPEEKIKIDISLLKDLGVNLENLNIKLTTASLIDNLPKIVEAKRLLQSKYPLLRNINFNTIAELIQKNIEMTSKESKTKHHLFSNIETVSKMYEKNPELGQTDVKNFLLNIYKKEKEEQSKGNYTFFHGRNKDIKFASDIYKELWQIVKGKKIGEDFTFIRFAPLDKVTSARRDQLFMNHALFGNVHEQTLASTVSQYWLKNYSIYKGSPENNPFNLLNIFKIFNLEKYYSAYKTELDQLKSLHDNLSKYGEILLISIPNNKINFVKPVLPGGSDAQVSINNKLSSNSQEILDALMQNPRSVEITNNPVDKKTSDYLEWALPLTTEYALDPFKGPKFYSFYIMNEANKKEYEKLKQELFYKIKKEIMSERAQSLPYSKL